MGQLLKFVQVLKLLNFDIVINSIQNLINFQNIEETANCVCIVGILVCFLCKEGEYQLGRRPVARIFRGGVTTQGQMCRTYDLIELGATLNGSGEFCEPLGVSGDMLPQKTFKSEGLKTPFPALSDR